MTLESTLSLNADSFEPDGPGDFGFSDLPDWAQNVIYSTPLLGNFCDILSAPVVIHTGCGPNQDNEANLCYDKPPVLPNGEHWECHGFLCYKHNDAWENNGQLSTFADGTKDIPVDTGTIPDTCAPGQVQSGALCYNDPGPGYNVIAGVAWAPVLLVLQMRERYTQI